MPCCDGLEKVYLVPPVLVVGGGAGAGLPCAQHVVRPRQDTHSELPPAKLVQRREQLLVHNSYSAQQITGETWAAAVRGVWGRQTAVRRVRPGRARSALCPRKTGRGPGSRDKTATLLCRLASGSSNTCSVSQAHPDY